MLQTHEMRLESLNIITMVELSHSTAHFVYKQFSPTSFEALREVDITEEVEVISLPMVDVATI